MKARIIHGADLAKTLIKDVRDRVESYFPENPPQLVSLAMGEDDPSSRIYISSQKKATQQAGIAFHHILLPPDTPEKKILKKIQELNQEDGVHGIIIQRPLPEHLDPLGFISALDPVKDVEGIHPLNLGAIVHGQPRLVPCTAEAAIRLFRSVGLETKGLEIVVVGHSEIVGKPISLLLVHELATVTVCHIATQNLKAHTRRADVLFVAAGVPSLVRADGIKPGAVVIDIGINRIEVKEGGNKETRIVGDVDFEGAARVAGFISPVPGGVGPVTTAVLMENTVRAALAQKSIP